MTNDKEFSLGPVPAANRQKLMHTLAVMLGFTFFSASMMAGGTLGTGLTFSQFILIVMLSNLLLGLYTGGLAVIASRTGLSTHLLTRYAFGQKGSYLTSLLLGGTQVGWFGVGIAMFALPVEKATGIPVPYLIAAAGILMTSSAFFGIKALTALSIVAVPAIAVLGSISVYRAASDIGGLGGLFDFQPQDALSFTAALTICVGSFISGGTLTPDFTRFASGPRKAFLATLIAFFLGNSLMFLFGAVGAISTGFSDISDVMLAQGLIIPAIVILGLNIWTTNDNALYASGLGFSNITKIPKNKLVIINGIVGTALSIWLYNNFIGFLTFLGSAIPSIGAIILADYFLVNRRKYDRFDPGSFKQVNVVAIAAWAAGFAAARLVPGIPPLNAVVVSAALYVVLTKLLDRSDSRQQTSETILEG